MSRTLVALTWGTTAANPGHPGAVSEVACSACFEVDSVTQLQPELDVTQSPWARQVGCQACGYTPSRLG